MTNFVTIVWYIKVTVTYLTEWHFCNDKFCHNSLIHQSNCHISYRNGIFIMTNFVPSLSHLTGLMTNFYPQFVTSHRCYDKFLSSVCHIVHVLWQFLSPVCHVSPMLWQILSNFCHIFWIFIHFLCIKCIFWRFVPFLSHFLSHGTNFVTFLTPQKPSNTKGFHDWSKICHIYPNFVPSLSRVCHVHKPRGYAVYT